VNWGGTKGERRSVIHKRLLYYFNVNRTSLDHLLLGGNADVDKSVEWSEYSAGSEKCQNSVSLTLGLAPLERAQEIDDVLLLLRSQPIEMFDYLICFAATALVISDGDHEVGRASIMEEEDALSDAPKRSGSELVGAGATLRDAVGEAFAHVVDDKVGVKIRGLIGKRSARVG